jgi:hypothetical protein
VGKPVGEAAQPTLTPDEQLEAALNAPVPNALKRETKERIQTLATKVKELMPQLQEVKRDRDELVGMITETGANPAQFRQMLDYLRMVNSSSRADREQALTLMQSEIAVLARSLGKPVPGVNMLEGHDDLIQAVGQGRIAPEHAAEIAAARERSKLEDRGSAQRTQQNDQQRQQQEALAQGRNALNQLEAQLHADPNYVAKRAILVKTLQPVFAQIHPSQWAATFKRAYDELPAPVAPAPRSVATTSGSSPANGGGNTPLRAANPAGGAPVAAPKNLSEAIDFGIAQARG